MVISIIALKFRLYKQTHETTFKVRFSNGGGSVFQTAVAVKVQYQ
jgi:hypothetical protein